MDINEAMIDKLASLSRLQFEKDKKAAIADSLGKMIGFVNKLNELDTTGVEPLLHIGNNNNVLRPDEPSVEYSREELLKNALHKDGQFFKVPKVIKK